MNIEYKNIKQFNEMQLKELFLSVEWSSGNYPDKLVVAMRNYATVFSAWDGEKLIGMICIMDDGIMTAYVHYLLVNPSYQGNGIGKSLVDLTTTHYVDYLRIVLISYDKEIDFYKRCGYEVGNNKTPMFITSMST